MSEAYKISVDFLKRVILKMVGIGGEVSIDFPKNWDSLTHEEKKRWVGKKIKINEIENEGLYKELKKLKKGK